jgi:hypothetical protein
MPGPYPAGPSRHHPGAVAREARPNERFARVGCRGAWNDHDPRSAAATWAAVVRPGRRQRDNDTQRGEAHFHAKDAFEKCAERAVGRIERCERNAGYGGWQCKRQIDGGVEPAPSRKTIANQHPGDDDPEHRIHEGRQDRRSERQLQ